MAKCAFGADSSKFLGFMVSKRGIGAKPKKIKTIMNMSPPQNINEVQRLAKQIARFNWFVSRLMEKFLPFFEVL